MSKIIRLHSIRVKSLTNPHDDLPAGMQMFAQLIIKEHIFHQTVAVDWEESQDSSTLDFRCNIPSHASTFSVAILRVSETLGTRLLGSIEVARDEAIATVESNQCVLHLEVNKVNPDGPLLKFDAEFSDANVMLTEPSSLNDPKTTENKKSRDCRQSAENA
ncbi:hypothetical protein K438DRAFT_1749867 [Mycena galopus ATCC 62051]|nr:hypothetical protein K438DRAFT_1749867 [Mycena galopus ATCC 62051]